jgi:HD-GYP domain-containing protein (c-di-GMP phosphodiesterase class II)
VLFVVPILVAREMFASYLRVREGHEATLDMLVRALEIKDRYTAGHAQRVARYARFAGEELGFTPTRLERLRYAALMHDIGKLAVPNHLLNKPGRLTADEFARVRVHEDVSFEMLSRIDFLRAIAPCARSEHTRFDPDDLERPIDPYIVAVADAYDAMTSTRSYRRALPQRVAFDELRAKAGTQFHPDCVEALIRAIRRRGEVHGFGHERELVEFPDAPKSGVGSAGLGDLLELDGTP